MAILSMLFFDSIFSSSEEIEKYKFKQKTNAIIIKVVFAKAANNNIFANLCKFRFSFLPCINNINEPNSTGRFKITIGTNPV